MQKYSVALLWTLVQLAHSSLNFGSQTKIRYSGSVPSWYSAQERTTSPDSQIILLFMQPSITISFFSSMIFVWNKSYIFLYTTATCPVLQPCVCCWLYIHAFVCADCCYYAFPAFALKMAQHRSEGESEYKIHRYLFARIQCPSTFWNITITSIYKSLYLKTSSRELAVHFIFHY